MYTINEVTNMPVIRPVVCLDKEEIINIARRIDTFEISIRPYEDCCTIFAPKNPKTRPSLEKSKELENSFDYEALIKDALNNIEVIHISRDDQDLF